ncbi:MAG: TetR/AcrR family transcriptional regulator [Acidimicrobiia bacterium]
MPRKANASAYDIPSRIENVELVASRRDDIMRAATELMVQKGYSPTGVDEVARKAGITVGALYKYIGSKRDLLLLIFGRLTNEVDQVLAESAEAAGPGYEALHRAITAFVTLCHEERAGFLIVYREAQHLSPDQLEVVAANTESTRASMLRVLQRASGDSVDVHEQRIQLLADSLVFLAHQWALQGRVFRTYVSIEEFAEFLTDLAAGQLGVTKPAR